MDFANIAWPTETPEGKRAALQSFVTRVGNGEAVPGWLLRVVADAVGPNVDALAPMPSHRPESNRDSYFLAWFASECDPDFNTLPKTRDGRYGAVGELLGCNASTAQRRTAAFARDRLATDLLLVYVHGEHYALKRRMPWPEALADFTAWFEAARSRRNK